MIENDWGDLGGRFRQRGEGRFLLAELDVISGVGGRSPGIYTKSGPRLAVTSCSGF